MDTMVISTSPLYREPRPILTDDVLGDRLANERHVAALERARQTTPGVAEEEARIAEAKARLEAGYYRDGQYLGQFAPFPRKDNQR
jgi:hypothetical protein